MKSLLKCLCICFALAGAINMTSAHCGGCGTDDHHNKEQSKVLSTKCGEVKGTVKCCKPAEKCGKCNLHKGSPGCDKAEATEASEPEFVGGCGVPMCHKCGYQLFTEECDAHCYPPKKDQKQPVLKKCSENKCPSTKKCNEHTCVKKK